MVASFPVHSGDQLLLVTDAGQLVRTTVEDIRIAGRSTSGVIVFRVADDERVVSVTRMGDDAAGGVNGANGSNGSNGADGAADSAPGNGAGSTDQGTDGAADGAADEEGETDGG